MSKEMKIIHLYVKETNTHHYYGSLKAMYQYFDKQQLGITYESLTTRGINKKEYYENNKIVIRKGIIYAMKQQREKETEQE